MHEQSATADILLALAWLARGSTHQVLLATLAHVQITSTISEWKSIAETGTSGFV